MAAMRKAVSHVTEVVFPPPKDYADIQRQELINTSEIFLLPTILTCLKTKTFAENKYKSYKCFVLTCYHAPNLILSPFYRS